ncbi:YjfB family protein [Neobacillus mesonae]|nr:YjfB family protein [Neobacillus mesonae]
MDIAAMSTAMSTAAVKQAASIQVLNMAKSQAEVMGTQMAQMLSSNAPHPTSGHTIDMKA